MGRLVDDFGHPHRVDIRIEVIEGGRIEVELVAKHDDEGAQISHQIVRKATRHCRS